MDKLDALALADDMRANYPGKGVGDRHVQQWAKELEHLTDREARRIVEMVTARSTDPPSRGQLLQTLAEVRKNTMSPRIDTSLCVYLDGVECRNCGIVHGHPIEGGQMFHGLYHKSRQWAGESGHEEAAVNPERCHCDFPVPTDVDPEKVVRMLVDALIAEWA